MSTEATRRRRAGGGRTAAIAAAAAAASVSLRLGDPLPADASRERLAEWLSGSIGARVEPASVAWEPSRGQLRDLVLGRPLLFVATAEREGAGDVHRAFVRRSPGGGVVGLGAVRNLTQTPFGDDRGLAVRGDRAVFATMVSGSVEAVSVLGLRPEHGRPRDGLDGVLAALTAFRETGSFAGLERTDVLLEPPARNADIAFDEARAIVTLDGGRHRVEYDMARQSVVGSGARVQAQRAEAKPPLLWAVDTVRDFVGPEPIAWLEQVAFGGRDVARRAMHTVSERDDTMILAEAPVAPAPAKATPVAPAPERVAWPPAAIESFWKERAPGEGQWVSVAAPWLQSTPPEASYAVETFIRPDRQRPYARLLLIALDMRRLELGIEAGFEDPKPSTGPRGPGRLPPDPDVRRRVVATFNGAFKTTHGNFGMMVRRRVLVPPVPGIATLLVTSDGRTALGSWAATSEIPGSVVSFRQNLDPLVEDGVANPKRRFSWGWEVRGRAIQTERTAICSTVDGHLLFAWGTEIDGPTLGAALAQAGCSYGIHLDMNPMHCGFVWTKHDEETGEFRLRRAHGGMNVNADRWIEKSPKDFFYVMRRDPHAEMDAPGAFRWNPPG